LITVKDLPEQIINYQTHQNNSQMLDKTVHKLWHASEQ